MYFSQPGYGSRVFPVTLQIPISSGGIPLPTWCSCNTIQAEADVLFNCTDAQGLSATHPFLLHQ
eukprot:1149759-Pelagomonas_calceolata.AAC.1